jgi:hypothetical protein
MSGREKGKKLFAELANKVRKEIAPNGEPELNKRGLEALQELADDLTGPDGLPGLRVFKDGVHQFRLQRPQRNGQIIVSWNRGIGAITIVVEKLSGREAEVKYLWREADDAWTRMEGTGELYEDVSKALVDTLYPEAKR